MNVEVLEKLMEQKGIKSYLHLSKEANIPYTSLRDWMNGKGQKLQNVELLSEFFQTEARYLIEPTNYYCVILEDDRIENFTFFQKEEELTAFCNLLLSENF